MPVQLRPKHRALARCRLGLAVCLLTLPACDSSGPAPRNLLVICIDTVRFDTFWFPEQAKLRDTLSAWNERALRFQAALSTSPWTLPAVASLLTGRYPADHGAGFPADGIANLDTQTPAPLAPSVPILTELLGRQGYRVAGFVTQPYLLPQFGLNRGYLSLVRTDKLVSHAERWIAGHLQQPSNAPFFLYLHFIDAHQAHMQGIENARASVGAMPPAMQEAARESAPAGICDEPDTDSCTLYLAYAQAVLKQRAAIAGLLSELERQGLLADTIALLYSDHGEEFADHTAPQRERGTDPRGVYGIGHGHAMYQELLHVPLLIWHPQLRGRDVELRVSLVDVAPTLLDWLGMPELGVGSQGASLAPALGSPTPTSPERPLYASSVAFGPPQTVVVWGDLKRIHRAQPEERILFDLQADPLEQNPIRDPVAESHLDELLGSYFEVEASGSPGSVEVSDETLRALHELGYLEGLEPK